MQTTFPWLETRRLPDQTNLLLLIE